MFGTLYEAIQVLQGEGYRKILNQDGSLELSIEDALIMATEEEPEKEIFFSVVGATVHVVKNGAPEPCPVATGVDKAENYMITYSAQQTVLPYVIKFCNLEEAIAYAESGAEEYSKTYQSVKWSIKLKESYIYEGGVEKIWEEVIGCDHPSYTGKIGGKKGGKVKTAKKAASSAENGKKGGRPKGFRKVAPSKLTPALQYVHQSAKRFSYPYIEAKKSPDFDILILAPSVHVAAPCWFGAEIVTLRLLPGNLNEARGTWFNGEERTLDLRTGKLYEPGER